MVLLLPLPGYSQTDAASAAAGDSIEEIVVTGSRLVRRDFNAPSPIFSLDSDTIAASGQPTLEETLNQMPQVLPDFGRTSNNPGDGTARLNLRGLGANRTLVMLNGRRIAPSGVGSAIDINMIPQALIQRVEVITGGASTVYGSDAVAGVVNFITHDDYDGLALDAGAYVTEEGDGQNYDINAAWGHNFSGGNLTLFGGYVNREELFAEARDLTSEVLQESWGNGIVQGGSIVSPVGIVPYVAGEPGEEQDYYAAFNPDGTLRDFQFPGDYYNFAPINYLQVPLERYYGGAFLTWQLGSAAELYTELAYTRGDGRQVLAPAPFNGNLRTNLDNPVLTPEASEFFATNFQSEPGIAAFRYGRRLSELGSRILDSTNEYTRLVAGLRGDLEGSWNYDAWLTWTDSEKETDLLNAGSLVRLRQGLLVDPATGQCYDPSGGCVPLNIFGEGNLAPDQVAFLKYSPFTNTTTREQMLASAFVRGEPLATWAGPLAVAVGLEWRSDEGSFRADDALFTNDAIGYLADSSVEGEEQVLELYTEAIVPLANGLPFAHYLSLELGGRYSEYDNAGSAETWKFGGEWEPVADLRFRVMLQHSVRAPDIQEAFQEQITDEGYYVGAEEIFDPCSAERDPVGSGNLDKCVIQGLPADQVGVFEATPFLPVDYVSGGNPALVPETADTLTYGIVYSGFESWTLSLDFFDLEVEDTIGSADVSTVCFDPGNTSNALCQKILRDPATYDVVLVDQRTSNLGALNTEGFDLQVSYGADLPEAFSIGDDYAGLDINFVWSSVDTNSIQPDPSVPPIECAGWFGPTCLFAGVGTTVPENRLFLSANYNSGKLSAILSLRWIEGTNNDFRRQAPAMGASPDDVAIQSIPSKTYTNLGFGYRFSDNLSANLSILNLFDTEAPLMADAALANNTDTQMYDIFGRSYRLAFSLAY